MEVQGEAVQVADVQRAKVVVEGVVEEAVVDGEVEGRLPLVLPAPRGRPRRVAVGEERVGRRWLRVSRDVEAVCLGAQGVSGFLNGDLKAIAFSPPTLLLMLVARARKGGRWGRGGGW